MKIWIEATPILNPKNPHKSGVSYYMRGLIEALLEIDEDDSITLIGDLFFTARPEKLRGRYKLKLIRYLPGKVWNQLIKRNLLPRVNWLLFRPGPDVMLNLNFVRLPISKNTKTITTIHDLSHMVNPQFVTPKTHQYLSRIPESLDRSTKIIAISEATKRDIIRFFGTQPGKIAVIPPGVDLLAFRPTELTSSLRQKYGLPQKYLLFLSTLEPRKNVSGLIEAYKLLPPEVRREYSLVLAGGRGWLDDEIRDAINGFDGEGTIITTGYVDGDDKAALYTGAAVFVFPSHYEGFGMPVLEAMACGTPVVTANNSSLPEAAGDAGILVDIARPSAITDAIMKVISDPGTAQGMRKRGMEHVQRFSWDSSAHKLKALIDELAD